MISWTLVLSFRQDLLQKAIASLTGGSNLNCTSWQKKHGTAHSPGQLRTDTVVSMVLAYVSRSVPLITHATWTKTRYEISLCLWYHRWSRFWPPGLCLGRGFAWSAGKWTASSAGKWIAWNAEKENILDQGGLEPTISGLRALRSIHLS